MLDLVEVKCKVSEKIIVESLSRIGIGDKKRHLIYPSCYLYKKNGKTYITHFKELFLLNGNGFNNLSDADYTRRDNIITCLKNWDLIEVVDESLLEPDDSFVFILPFKDKKDWTVKHKYRVSYRDEE